MKRLATESLIRSPSKTVSKPNSWNAIQLTMTTKRIRWKLGALSGLAVVLITLIPQVSLWTARGRDWKGAYALTDTDELAYSGYLNSIINGKPRRNDPSLGVQAEQLAAKHETFLSVQFFPPYAIAWVSRVFGLTASTAFILLTPVFAFAASLAVFWLLVEVGGDEKAAAIGVLLVLLCGVLASANPLTEENYYGVFSFLRRYIPAFPFPLFFVFCVFVWRAFTGARTRSLWWAVAAGLIFSILIYSYFYLWTAAGAWLFSFTVLWLILRPEERTRVVKATGIIFAIATVALIPYFYLLSQRAATTDNLTALQETRFPDLFRFTEILGLAIIAAIVYGIRKGVLSWKSPVVLFAASCVSTTFIVLNQHVLTGRSLQPFHYEQFILNYLILGAAVVLDARWGKYLTRRPLICIAIALVIGLSLALKTSRVNLEQNRKRDEALPIFTTLERDLVQNRSTGAVLFDQTVLAASAPSSSSLSLLWSPYMYAYGTIGSDENKERLFQYFYFLGADENRVRKMLSTGLVFRAAVFGLERVNKTLAREFTAVTDEEVGQQVEAYKLYAATFSAQVASKWPILYVVVSKDHTYDFSNLDRWYQRDAVDGIGNSLVFRVRRRNGE
jgi:hypothetical protein